MFTELYCADNDCDCRNVYIMVYHVQSKSTLATISYGWEPLSFYKKWMGVDVNEDDPACEMFKGPALAMAQQSKYADTLLGVFKNILMADQAYLDRLAKHYSMVKGEVEKKAAKNL